MLKRQNRLILATSIFLLFPTVTYGCSQGFMDNDSQLEEKVLNIIQENPKAISAALQEQPNEQEQELQQQRSDFLQQIKNNPSSVIKDSPIAGSEDFQFVLVEFSDFQCPFCSQANESLKDFMSRNQNEVTLVYKHLPLNDIHSEAMPAAEAAWAASQQGKFWEYHDALFENQNTLGESLYLELAEQMELDIDKFNADRELASEKISQDIELAESLGIQGTPFFILNEEVFSGAVGLSELETRLQRAKQHEGS